MPGGAKTPWHPVRKLILQVGRLIHRVKIAGHDEVHTVLAACPREPERWRIASSPRRLFEKHLLDKLGFVLGRDADPKQNPTDHKCRRRRG